MADAVRKKMRALSTDTGWTTDTKFVIQHYILEVRDKNDPSKNSPSIATLFVTRHERSVRDKHDGPLEKASLVISYEVISPGGHLRRRHKGEFCGAYSNGYGGGALVSLTNSSIAKGALVLDPEELRGQFVGSYLMNEIVTWARQWVGATVMPIELSRGDATPHNKLRRNRFYEQFGLEFVYDDDGAKESGCSRQMPVSALRTVTNFCHNITEHEVSDLVVNRARQIAELQLELATLQRDVERLARAEQRAKAAPVRWAIGQVRVKMVGLLKCYGVLMAIFGLTGLAIWQFVFSNQ